MSSGNIISRHRWLAINLALVLVAIGVVGGLRTAWGPDQALAAKDEVCICHATGLAPSDHFVTVCANRTAIFGKAGHFNEDGTPQAGHEEDKLGPCEEPDPSPAIN